MVRRDSILTISTFGNYKNRDVQINLWPTGIDLRLIFCFGINILEICFSDKSDFLEIIYYDFMNSLSACCGELHSKTYCISFK